MPVFSTRLCLSAVLVCSRLIASAARYRSYSIVPAARVAVDQPPTQLSRRGRIVTPHRLTEALFGVIPCFPKNQAFHRLQGEKMSFWAA